MYNCILYVLYKYLVLIIERFALLTFCVKNEEPKSVKLFVYSKTGEL